jgi:diguanylate cyclase (GGDEF)-like protein
MRALLPGLSLRFVIGGLALLCGAALGLALPLGIAAARLGAEAARWAVVGGVLGALAAIALRRAVLQRFDLDQALQREAQTAEHLRFHAAINNMSQGLCFFDGQQRLIVCNNRYAGIYGLSRELMRPGTTLREIVEHRFAAGCIPSNMTREAYLKWRDSIVVADKPSSTITTLIDGRTISIRHQPMPNGGWVATHDDITETRRAQAEIEHMAHHDALTGLPNRVRFRSHLDTALQGDRHPVAVLCLDLDRFKAVNDTLGHPAGDQLLRMAADRLASCVRQGDLVARLGGDEFAIVQLDGEQPSAAEALAQRVVQAMTAPFEIAGHAASVGTSVGIALSDGAETVSPDELLKRADLALYDAKTTARGRHSFFRPELDRRAKGRHELEADLRRAIEQGALELHYQPLIGLHDDRVLAFEALVRWPHPRRGMVMPDQFIPLAEEVGLIDALGAWVLARACEVAASWPAHLGVAVNLSPLQLKSGRLVDVVRDALSAGGLAAARLELEITESVPLDDNSISLATLHGLRALGVRVSIDDFGAGFSSVSYLRKFPFDKIKIDRSFVRDVATDRSARAIVHAMATLGNSLGMAVTAEGVESTEQLQAVREMGCTQAQGYLISTPRPAAELPAILRKDLRLAAVALGRSSAGRAPGD